MARECEAAAPILRPVRCFEIVVGLRQPPETAVRAGFVRADLWNRGNRREWQVRFDKGGDF